MSREYQIGEELTVAIESDQWDRCHKINESQTESLFGITVEIGGMTIAGRILKLEARPNIVVHITSVEPLS